MGESSFNATPIGCPSLRGALLLVRYFKPFQTSYHYAYRGISNHFCCISHSFSKEHSLLKAHILIELIGFRTKSRFLRVIKQFKMIGYLASHDFDRTIIRMIVLVVLPICQVGDKKMQHEANSYSGHPQSGLSLSRR